LLGSVPRFDGGTGRLVPIPGNPPSLLNPPPGCPFHPRCRYRELTGGRAETERPQLRAIGPAHSVACHLDDAQRRRIVSEEVPTWL
jgi:peptide/nickel transport system ATP-binding protein